MTSRSSGTTSAPLGRAGSETSTGKPFVKHGKIKVFPYGLAINVTNDDEADTGLVQHRENAPHECCHCVLPLLRNAPLNLSVFTWKPFDRSGRHSIASLGDRQNVDLGLGQDDGSQGLPSVVSIG